ncbi:MAG: radical SAM protein [Deltaproteobacteria bacterium]|nr:radical SAM protein [Deltaproteobacteria bacterium]
MFKKYRIIRDSFRHTGTGSNATIFRMFRQLLPYFFRRDGYSYNPLTVFLSVNSVCNFKCKTCDIGQQNEQSTFYKNLNPGGSRRTELDYDRVKDLIDEISSFNPFLAITTTEPLLYKPIGKVINYATVCNMQTLITTNGYLLEQRAEELIDAGLKSLCISLDGPAEVHDGIRCVEGAFEQALVGIRALTRLRKKKNLEYPRVNIASTISNFNYGHLYELFCALELESIDYISVSQFNYVSDDIAEKHNSLYSYVGSASTTSMAGGADPSKVDVGVLFREINKIKRDFGNRVVFSPDLNLQELWQFYHNPEKIVWNNRCLIPWYVTEIIANGDVIPMTRCFDVTLGNIYESCFSEIWNGNKMRKFRGDLKRHKLFPACSRCRGCL